MQTAGTKAEEGAEPQTTYKADMTQSEKVDLSDMAVGSVRPASTHNEYQSDAAQSPPGTCYLGRGEICMHVRCLDIFSETRDICFLSDTIEGGGVFRGILFHEILRAF